MIDNDMHLQMVQPHNLTLGGLPRSSMPLPEINGLPPWMLPPLYSQRSHALIEELG